MLGKQNIIKDINGRDRFEENLLVGVLVDNFKYKNMSGLNALSFYYQANGVAEEHYSQITQLIGYSISGWGTLSTTTDEDWEEIQKVLEESDG